MNGDAASAREYCAALLAADRSAWEGLQPFVIPPATLISAVRAALGPAGVLVGAQNAHWEDKGAWTGELSVPQVADAGAQIVEIGHSERREYFNETDETVNLKVKAILAHDLRPLVCVGEDRSVFEAGGSVEHVCAQVDAALRGVDDTSTILLAYEPIWAIGEKGREPMPGDLEKVFDALQGRYGDRVEATLYGGSVNPGNAARLLGIPGVSGLFVGRSAWSGEGYAEILRLAGGAVGAFA